MKNVIQKTMFAVVALSGSCFLINSFADQTGQPTNVTQPAKQNPTANAVADSNSSVSANANAGSKADSNTDSNADSNADSNSDANSGTAASPLKTKEVPITYEPNPISNNRLISLNFTNIKTKELLQVISQFVGINFVVSDSVQGSMSLHLKQVPWRQALNVILKSQGLGMREMENVILVAPITELTKYEVQEIQAKDDLEKLAPLYNMIIRLNYANAEEVYKTIANTNSGALLSERGKITFDKRTNTLWLRDTRSKINGIQGIVLRLDRPVKQVLIEARIVEIAQNFESELGARFGLYSPPHLSGSLENPPLEQSPNLINLNRRLNFNLPSVPAFGGGRAGSIAISLARFGNTFLDLELSALQEERKVHLVSSPRLVTSDLHPAYIQTGEEIPYQESTSSGATAIQFKDATLNLKVTPQITPDGRVLMYLTVGNNRAGNPVNLEGGGQAIPIITQEEQSQVLVNNKQTIVLGGVYTEDKRDEVSRVPFFGAIPYLGVFFRHNYQRDRRTELLIFLTPHIINNPRQLSRE